MVRKIIFIALVQILFGTDTKGTPWSTPQILGPAITSSGHVSIEFQGYSYLFVNNGGQIAYRRSVDGRKWQSLHGWDRISVKTNFAPAAVVFKNKIYLFYTNMYGKVNYRIYDGTIWSAEAQTNISADSEPSVGVDNNSLYLFRINNHLVRMNIFNGIFWGNEKSLTGRETNFAPSVINFNGKLHLFISTRTGQFSYLNELDAPSWQDIGCMNCAVYANAPVSAIVSQGKVLLFTTNWKTQRILMRVLDSSLGSNLFLPEDDWMDVGVAASSVAACALKNRVLLYFEYNLGIPGAAPFYSSTIGIACQSVDWTIIPLAILQIADDNCANPANLSKVPKWIQYANLVYSPLMIEYTRSLDLKICVTKMQGDAAFDDSVARDVIAGKSELKDKVPILIRARASGGAFSGAGSSYVAMPEDMMVCDLNGETSFSFFNNDLAHELGHFWGLPHTFHDDPHYSGSIPKTKSQVELMLANNDLDLFRAFDHDLEEASVTDTPPDPLYEMNGVSDEKCTSFDTPVTLNVNGQTITLVPPRTNVMSYYQTTGTIVNKLTPGQRKVIYCYISKKLGL